MSSDWLIDYDRKLGSGGRKMGNLLTTLFMLCECDVVTDLSGYLKHVVSLGYTEKPNYQFCRGVFTKALKSVGAKATDRMDFGPAVPVTTTKPAKPRVRM